ncbi:hypothetical protein AKJ65_01280 [candidate division MSBL1 archaeon SCGC-AAA259E19]|uniref:Uncharacterized protein n=1 Tax=candidate division MSBL1 archaeon SCGC-AAA259E19 TaxID=1698264 RepID=A0A133UN39_9EURY|nr:hypothetical protein AKJ65_01280 [candidate division MSBL1 archaeon SCGC-AAA259E19]
MDRDRLRDELLALSEKLTGEELDYAIDYLEVEGKRIEERSQEDSVVDFVDDYCEFGPERVYLLMAIARAKDNPFSSSEEVVFREVIRNKREIQEKYDKLRSTVNGRTESEKSYNFRLHLSVNARNTTKAYFNFRSRMNGWVEDRLHGDENYEKFKNLDRRWLSELSRPSSKDETNFLVDLDDDDELGIDEVRDLLTGYTVVQVKKRTPNGFHLVTNSFDYSNLPTGLDIKTDALLFLEHISGGENYGN